MAAPAIPKFDSDAKAGIRRLLLALMVISFLIPAHLHVSTLTMGFTRAYLLVTFIPACIMFLRAKDLRMNAVDLLMIGFISWATLSIYANHGTTQVEFMGLQLIDMFGAYLLGRVLIRTPSDYAFFWRWFGYGMVLIFPVALVELLSERFLLHELLGGFMDVFDNATIGYPRRWGFDRVQGNLEHPILFGVFWGLGFASLVAVFPNMLLKAFFGSICIAMAGLSLSSGAYLVIIFQVALLGWAIVTKGNWKLLLILFALLYIAVEIVSDRPALVALSTRLAFSSGTAYARVHIWNFGVENVMAHPLFGLGLNEWERPHWLGSSIDNNWLLVAVRGGLPTIGFLLAAFATMMTRLIRDKNLPKITQLYRRNFLITFVSMFIALGTVAVWSGTSSFLFFLLGMGTSLPICKAKSEETADQDAVPEQVSRYTRQTKPHAIRRRGGAVRPQV